MGGSILKLTIVGIGPGNKENMTLLAHRALEEAQVIVGYPVYVNLIKDNYPGREFLTTGMTHETERCRMALEEARKGRKVAMVCSGDSGVYGMAALCFELRGEEAAPEIQVVPGLTAACSGGAVLGAPLTHDFAVISLSDRLTPWEKIAARLRCAAQGDFAIAIYNPKSKGRPDHLARACDILLEILPRDRLCGVVRNIGREGEQTALMRLDQLRDFDADMFCTVFIGNAQTRSIAGKMVTPRGYRNG